MGRTEGSSVYVLLIACCCCYSVAKLILFEVLYPDFSVTKAQSSSFLSHELLQRGSWLPICSFTSPSVFDFCSFPFLFLPHPQIPQDSPEQEASKSPRGAVPVSTEASLPPEATPQMSIQSTTPIANYSQVSHRERGRSRRKRRVGGVHEWKSEVVRRGNCENCDMEAKIKRREGAEMAEIENKEEVILAKGWMRIRMKA